MLLNATRLIFIIIFITSQIIGETVVDELKKIYPNTYYFAKQYNTIQLIYFLMNIIFYLTSSACLREQGT